MSAKASEEPAEEEKHFWTHRAIYEFIKMYESFPELWNPMHADHKDRNRRYLVIKEMANHFSVSTHEVNRKIHILRSQIRSEIKKYYVMGESVDGSDDVYKGKWPFFHHLKFVVPLIADRKKFVSSNDYTFSMDASSSVLDSEDDTVSYGDLPSKKFKSDESVDFEDSNPFLDSEILGANKNSNDKPEANGSKSKRLRDSTISIEEKLSWSKSASLEMIQLYRSYSALWDCDDPLYKNKAMRQQIIQKLARHFKVGFEEINRKIHNIRSQMISEIKKHYVMGNSLDGSDDVYKGQWPFFHHMKFISPLIAARKKFVPTNTGAKKIVKTDGDDDNHEDISLDFCEQYLKEDGSGDEDMTNSYEEIHLLPNNNIEIIETDKESPGNAELDPIFIPLNQSANKSRSTKPKRANAKYNPSLDYSDSDDDNKNFNNLIEDDCQIFGKYVASELRAVSNDKQRKLLRRKILTVIMEFADEDDQEKN